MTRRLIVSIATALACAALPAAALAQAEYPEQPRTAPRSDSPIVEKGPCFDVAAASMPDGEGHDHLDLTQHNFSCGFSQAAFLPLTDVLAERSDVMLGESDVESDIAAVAVAYPESGLLTFDVKDPASPKFLSWYRGGDCDVLVLDTDCGAYVSLSSDGKLAFISIQALSPLGNGGFNGTTPTTQPGVQVVSLEDPTAPQLVDFLPVAGYNGVHTANYHEIPGQGEYVFMTANSVGIQIAQVVRTGPAARLLPVNTIPLNEAHDTFLHNDPIDNRTYMYVAAGNTTGFYVYDVTNPLAPELKAEWDLRPDCHRDWYAHTIDVAIRGNRRYVTMPTETFYFGTQDEDPSCGEIYGNGDRPGVMWIVDATDFSKLGPANDADANDPPDPELAQNSQKALVATWHNAANAAGGDLKFSPHNQQVVGDTIYLSSYHGGVIALNAKAAFEGRNERPYEEGVVIPNAGKRGIYKPPSPPLNGAFISSFFSGHPDIWDMNYYKGYVLAYDEFGGMYSFKPEPPQAASCTDATAPTARVRRARISRRGITISGIAEDRACAEAGTVRRVSVAVARRRGSRCAHLVGRRGFTKPKSCRAAAFRPAKGTARFTFKLKTKLRPGRYLVTVRAADQAGNTSRGPRRTLRLR